MRVVPINTVNNLPCVRVRLTGPRASENSLLVFDTGSEVTNIDTGIIENIGYSASSANKIITGQAVFGETQQGYLRLFKVIC